jgi:type I restriction-modification system DNA methylase subunit
MTHFQTYFTSLKKTLATVGKSALKEDNFRTAFENLLGTFAKDGIAVLQEPSTAKKGLGVPDFRVSKNDAVLGYIETKVLGEDLDEILKSPQIAKYCKLSDNLIVTDYALFILLRDGKELKRATLFDDAKDLQKLSAPTPESIKNVEALLVQFFQNPTEKISEPKQVAERLAFWANEIRLRTSQLILSTDESADELKSIFNGFKQDLLKETNPEGFADVFAQTLTYGLFLSKLSTANPLRMESVLATTPQGVPLLNDFFKTIANPNTTPEDLTVVVGGLLATLNTIDTADLERNLILKASGNRYLSDPYIYFYEDFLKLYDNTIRVEKGAYYTPKAVVSYITRSASLLISEKLSMAGGVANKQVKLLDFATGTGTFLLSIFEEVFAAKQILGEQGKHSAKKQLLDNAFGFELMPAPYMVAHLKLTEFLKQQDVPLTHKERIKIYLTNTLDNEYVATISALPNITREGNAAQHVKVSEEILLITGNPPYNARSNNNTPFIERYLWNYKDGLNEKKLSDDDYKNFLLFAQQKLEAASKGIVAVITNNSFIDSITERVMRKRLLEAFDEIYILDLHGSTTRREILPEGSPDENVFDIRQGVSISFFVKHSPKPKTLFDEADRETVKRKPLPLAKVFHASLLGSRDAKYKYLLEHDWKTTAWQELTTVDVPTDIQDSKDQPINFYFFKPFDTSNLATYTQKDAPICVKDIFMNFNSGIQTKRDELTIHFTKDELKTVVEDFINLDKKPLMKKYNLSEEQNEKSRDWKVEWAKADLKKIGWQEKFIQKIDYRPFDSRWTYFQNKSKSFIAYPRYETMQHLIKGKNVALTCLKLSRREEKNRFLVSENLVGKDMISILDSCSVFPLYLYKSDDSGLDFDELQYDSDGKTPNFTKAFQAFLKTRYPKHQPTPEAVLGYIYGMLYVPQYRETYSDYLAISFPFIPFVKEWKVFKKISSLGWRLVELHLLKVETKSQFKLAGKGTNRIDAVKTEGNKLFINKTQYFEGTTEDVLAFEVGGYKVLERYVKSRKGRDITGDLEHLQHVEGIIRETMKTMKSLGDVSRTLF